MRYVADTIAIVRHLSQSKRIGEQAKKILRGADSGANEIIISGITLMEIMYLSEKGRIGANLTEVVELIAGSDNYLVYPVDTEVILEAKEIKDIPELIGALLTTALPLGAFGSQTLAQEPGTWHVNDGNYWSGYTENGKNSGVLNL